MPTVTRNYQFELLAPSQEQPEVLIDFNWNKLDGLLPDLGGSVTVEQFGNSPGITGVRKIVFHGATVEHETGGIANVIIEEESGHSGGADVDVEHVVIQLACSDLVTALSAAAGVAYVRAPKAFTLTGVRSSLQTVSSSGLVTVDINKNGVTVLSTELSIDATEKTSTTAATPAVISVSAIADDDELSIDISAAGTGAKGLIVTLLGSV
jgi:hypothetical protein